MKGERLVQALFAVATLSRLGMAAESSTATRASPPSQAQRPAPAAPDPAIAAASEAFRRASELAKSGDWEGALAAYQESARLKPHPLTTYDIAFCERALGRYVHASLHFEEVLLAAADYSLPRDLVSDATRCLDEVRSRIVHVSVVRHPQDLSIRVDGVPLERTKTENGPVYVVGAETTVSELPSGDIELLVDPGNHVFVGTGPGEARVIESQSYLAGQQAVVTLSLPEQVTPPVRSPAPKPEVRDAPAPRPNHTAAHVAFGVGGAGLVAAAVFSGLALSEKHTLDANGVCVGKVCPPQYADTESRMTTYADVATVSIATFAAGAAVGTYLLLTAPSPSPSKSASVRIVPWFAGQSGGVIGRF
jgi:hypothetical protein